MSPVSFSFTVPFLSIAPTKFSTTAIGIRHFFPGPLDYRNLEASELIPSTNVGMLENPSENDRTSLADD